MCRARRLLVSPSSIDESTPLRTNFWLTVDGAAWRTAGGNPGVGFQYPDFLLSDETVSGVKGTKKAKL